MTKAHWFVGPSPSDDENLALLLRDPIKLRRKDGLPALFLTPFQLFRIIEDTRYDGEYKASTLAYIYAVQLDAPENEGDSEVIAWHWHPLTTPDRPAPHIHVRAERNDLGVTMSKAHIPSGRVSFEEIIRFLIEDLHVEPDRPEDWQEIVGDSESRFKTFRTWA